MRTLRAISRDRSGATAIEYALVASLIAVAAIVAMRGLGLTIDNSFKNINNAVATHG